MKKNIRSISYLLLIFALLFSLSGCNNEDDVMTIFNGKTWKLSRLTTEGSNARFYSGLWNNTKEEEASITALNQSGNFTLRTSCAEVNGEVTGTADIHGIKASISNATLKIDGKSRTISINGKISTTESDPLAKAFINGILNAYKYEGDTNTLTIYFNDGNTTKIMGFTAQQE
ncbi:DUF4847 family protein [Bacteroides cellulosilyticus]|jgi:hypothetical protein|uniref:DUF4847 family protein n=1 Tax=Bacteroides cellulosilyticus TaxID=246787 RepID=UPI001898CB34|nr:DUF4847 family protein [Bacteroides cellulosilyticus]